MQNIVLIGMPGSGKTTLAQELAKRLEHRHVDVDEEIVRTAGCDIASIFRIEGEADFRARETVELAKWCKESGLILSTGGGCVTRPENRNLLRQNGVVIWIRRSLKSLSTDGRPLSQVSSLETMYEARRPLYEAFSDYAVDNDGTIEQAVDRILEVLK